LRSREESSITKENNKMERVTTYVSIVALMLMVSVLLTKGLDFWITKQYPTTCSLEKTHFTVRQT
jgi:hypothetical protein